MDHEDDERLPVATALEGSELPDLRTVGGSNWFNDGSSRYYSGYDSEMEYIAQYHHVAELEPTEFGHSSEGRYPLGEEDTVERSGSRKVLPPRNPSEVSRSQVTRDVLVPDYIDELATPSKPNPPTPVLVDSPNGKWAC